MAKDPLVTNSSSRRNFLRAGLAGTVATAAYPALGAARIADPPAGLLATSAAKDFELDEVTIEALQKAMQEGHATSHSLT